MTEFIYQLRELLINKIESEPLKYNNESLHEYTGTIDGEIFDKYENNSEILVSNHGRIKYKDKIIKQEKKGNYLIVNIPVYLNGKKDSILYVHKMVAETFLKKDNPDKQFFIVHHKSGNSFDNRVENLIYVTCLEHALIHDYYPPICLESRKYWEKENPEYCKDCPLRSITAQSV